MNTTEYKRYADNLKCRVRSLHSMGMPVTTFCREADISHSSYYRWMRDATNLRQTNLAKIDTYLSKLNL